MIIDKDKAEELSQKYFPDNLNIYARENIEAKSVESAAMEMAEFKGIQLKNQEQSLLWTLYSILDKIAIEGEARAIAIKEFKDHLINKNLE
jgi:hypothetical protein